MLFRDRHIRVFVRNSQIKACYHFSCHENPIHIFAYVFFACLTKSLVFDPFSGDVTWDDLQQ